MKVYISADIEGVTGVTHWDETDLGKEGWNTAREQMTAEVVAACEGALQAGATETGSRMPTIQPATSSPPSCRGKRG